MPEGSPKETERLCGLCGRPYRSRIGSRSTCSPECQSAWDRARRRRQGRLETLRAEAARLSLRAGLEPLVAPPSPHASPRRLVELDREEALEVAMRAHVMRVLEAHGGRRKETARALGVNPSTLFRWLKAWAPQPLLKAPGGPEA